MMQKKSWGYWIINSKKKFSKRRNTPSIINCLDSVGIEPTTSRMQSERYYHWSNCPTRSWLACLVLKVLISILETRGFSWLWISEISDRATMTLHNRIATTQFSSQIGSAASHVCVTFRLKQCRLWHWEFFDARQAPRSLWPKPIALPLIKPPWMDRVPSKRNLCVFAKSLCSSGNLLLEPG